MIRRQHADRCPFAEHAVPLGDQVANHAHKGRIGADRRRPDHLNTQLTAEVGRFGVEIEKHLHVI